MSINKWNKNKQVQILNYKRKHIKYVVAFFKLLLISQKLKIFTAAIFRQWCHGIIYKYLSCNKLRCEEQFQNFCLEHLTKHLSFLPHANYAKQLCYPVLYKHGKGQCTTFSERPHEVEKVGAIYPKEMQRFWINFWVPVVSVPDQFFCITICGVKCHSYL